jgi:hypothetical protein
MSKWIFLTALVIGCDVAPDAFSGSTDSDSDTDTDFDSDDTENSSDSAVGADTDTDNTDTGDNPVCTPNGMDNCTCPEGGSGVRICNADGSGWGACLCSEVETDTDRCDDYRIYGGDNTGELCMSTAEAAQICADHGGTGFYAQNCVDNGYNGQCCKQPPLCPEDDIAYECMMGDKLTKCGVDRGGKVNYNYRCDMPGTPDAFCCEDMDTTMETCTGDRYCVDLTGSSECVSEGGTLADSWDCPLSKNQRCCIP